MEALSALIIHEGRVEAKMAPFVLKHAFIAHVIVKP